MFPKMLYYIYENLYKKKKKKKRKKKIRAGNAPESLRYLTLDSVSLFAIVFLMLVTSRSVKPSDSKAGGGGPAFLAAAEGTDMGVGVAGVGIPRGGATCTMGAGLRPLSLIYCSKSLQQRKQWKGLGV